MSTDIFLSKLVGCQVHSTERAPTYLILDDVLVDTVVSMAARVIFHVLGTGIERFFDLAMGRGCSFVMPHWALELLHIARSRAGEDSEIVWLIRSQPIVFSFSSFQVRRDLLMRG